jgi:hypothetical protein
MVRVAAGDEEAGECLGNPGRSRLGPVTVEMTQCGAHVAPVVDRPGELRRRSPLRMCWIVDRSTVLANVWKQQSSAWPAPAEAILRGSSDTDTMTVADLLRSQRG